MLKKLLACAFAFLVCFVSETNSHTNSIGYVGEGAGAVTFWYGSWHSNTTFNEGSIKFEGANGTSYSPVVTPFNLFSPTVPTGLTAGTNWFQSNGTALVPYGQGTTVSYVYQGVRFTNLQPGQYTFTYIPLGNPLSYAPNGTPTADWAPQDNVILSSTITLTSAIISPPGTAPTLPRYNGPDSAWTMDSLLRLGNSTTVAYLLAHNNAMFSLTEYDCAKFTIHNVCFSVISKYNAVREFDSTFSGVVVAAWRPIPEIRIGAWAEQTANHPSISGVSYRSAEPSVGAFSVFEENTDNTGFRLRTAFYRATNSLRLSRDTIGTSEPGYGMTTMNTIGYGGEVSYGMEIDPAWKVAPYVGFWKVSSERSGYTESGVSYPITYSRNEININNATAGLRFLGRIEDNINLIIGAGIEKNLDTKQMGMAGSSNVLLLENFTMSMPSLSENIRGVGSVGVSYDIDKDQTVMSQVVVKQLPEIQSYATGRFGVTALVKYQVAF